MNVDIRDFTLNSLTQSRQVLVNQVKDLTPAQLHWMPSSETNSLGFLIFHTFRTEDLYGHTRLGSAQEVWQSKGGHSRWKIPDAPAGAPAAWTTGNGWTPKELASFQVPPLSELLAYGEAERESVAQVIKTFDMAKYEEPVNPANPQQTRGRLFRTLIVHEIEHRSHIDLLLGLGKATGFKSFS